ncbi:hypothetical protein [Paenibacillus sp. GCM10027626]|uniref:hypothetical protein n=1 Tax=Paenibacillus sp. GCM10027626 TaxID=3273411 RepID=UPI0036419051
MSVHQPRKPEWLADNLDNPFRSLDGREGITPAQAKKAAALYKQLRAQVRSLAASAAEEKLGAAEAQEQIESLFSVYIEGFNVWQASCITYSLDYIRSPPGGGSASWRMNKR